MVVLAELGKREDRALRDSGVKANEIYLRSYRIKSKRIKNN